MAHPSPMQRSEQPSPRINLTNYQMVEDYFFSSNPQKNGISKWWRFKYRFEGKEKQLSLGTYPEITLLSAREKREEFRKLVAEGIDPSQERKAAKATRLPQHLPDCLRTANFCGQGRMA